MARTALNAFTTSVVSSRKVVTTAGTAVAISATSLPVIGVDFVAETDNTGRISIGGSAVVAAVGTTCTGVVLNAGDSWCPAGPVDLKDIYIDSSVNGDGVTFTYVTGA